MRLVYVAARTSLCALSLAGALAACEPSSLPAFANPPPYDAGVADEGGDHARDADQDAGTSSKSAHTN
jgi:hypothetical protein